MRSATRLVGRAAPLSAQHVTEPRQPRLADPAIERVVGSARALHEQLLKQLALCRGQAAREPFDLGDERVAVMLALQRLDLLLELSPHRRIIATRGRARR